MNFVFFAAKNLSGVWQPCSKGLSLIMLLLSTVLMSQGVQAGSCLVRNPSFFNVGSITPVGSVRAGQNIGAPGGYTAGGSGLVNCSYTFLDQFRRGRASFFASGGLVSTGMVFSYSGINMPVYSTNVPGVGIAMMGEGYGRTLAATRNVQYLIDGVQPSPTAWNATARLFVVATGPVSRGTVAGQLIAGFQVNHEAIGGNYPHHFNLAGFTVNPSRKPTCRVATPSIPINMGAVASSQFGGPGSSAGGAQGTLSVTCAAGTGPAMIAKITMTDQTQPANRSTNLNVTPESTAQGVALRLSYNGTPIAYGPDSAAAGNPGQWQLFSSNDTVDKQHDFVIRASYVQTQPNIIPGTANGRATFTMSYQ